MKLIGIVGMPGSGKSAIFEIAKKYNIPVISMGDIVRQETLKKGLEITPENIGNTAIELRKKYGEEAVAVPCVEYIEKNYKKESIVIIEGIRSMYEVNYFKRYYPLKIIAIHSSPKTRFNRLKQRDREDDISEWKDFIERDMRELKFTIGNVISLADYMVINEGDYNSYLNNLERVLKIAMES
ncbi:flagellar hook-basal body complex protein FliE [Methanothermococcus sp. SCGC AD-155-C09]|nr:flagellar hook-basal body complex protein FliE [Methanothermococcus sp. SCGC AD-155-C09]MBW9222085.1 flagellar hook-basal body complex protein FliE [Methanothermococcus sp. SCGC AD-155-C09]